MDYCRINWRRPNKNAVPEIYPVFVTKKSRDLMIRGGDFYAVWDERNQMWSTDQDTVVDLIDSEMEAYKAKLCETNPDMAGARIMYMWRSDSGSIDKWLKFVTKQMPDCYVPLNETIVFANTPRKRELYSSISLPYALEEGDTTAWDEMTSVLYSPEELHKIEWAIGSIVAGESKNLQKFFVFYGAPKTGKSTIMNIIEKLFQGYTTAFDAKALGSSSGVFALEAFRSNPLIAIQQDGDLSKIEDNTRLNSLISHETMMVNEKYKAQYPMRINTILFMGTNKPVKISDSKSGILRRLVDISPTEKRIPRKRYDQLFKQIDFELGAIAWKCLQVFNENPNYYDDYVPTSMMGATNDFFNFMEENFEYYKGNDQTTLNESWNRYKLYCEEAKVPFPYPKRIFKEELKNYFQQFKDRYHPEKDIWLYNWYGGFRLEKFGIEVEADGASVQEAHDSWLKFDTTSSIFDRMAQDYPAQLATEDGTPAKAWDDVDTVLADIDTSELHYVRLPIKHIVIDFDKKDKEGNKSLELNMQAASKWPETYAELSKSGMGIHLHYLYTGDPEKLSRVYEPEVEVKVFNGKSSLRRKLSRCNDIPVATLSSGLPLKGAQKVVAEQVIKDEKHLRNLIQKALRKEIEPFATKPCIDFIDKILRDAYESGMKYDVTDLKPSIYAFALASSHNSLYCIDKADQMIFQSDEPSQFIEAEKDELMFFDVEVFPNLFVTVVKPDGKSALPMINPSSTDIENVCKFKLVGFNNRKYDNHIFYGRMMGMNEFNLYTVSQNIINGGKDNSVMTSGMYREACNLSHTDVFDFSSKKQSLKKWEIELEQQWPKLKDKVTKLLQSGMSLDDISKIVQTPKRYIERFVINYDTCPIKHDELGLPWDQPVPEELWGKVAEYCINDVVATEAVFYAREADFKARQILVDLANSIVGPGSTVNDTTNQLTAKLIVRNDKNPQSMFVYPDLSKEFPGYEYSKYGIDKSRYISPDVVISGKSIYKGYDPGEGGFVYAQPGMYGRSICLDSASHHPSSLIAENGFGPYTENFKALLDIRLHIKHKEYDEVKKMFGGVMAPYLKNKDDAKMLSSALKIAINSVYGLTAAHFDNKLRDPRNIDNWVAKRGALFMIDLMLEVQKKGWNVIHIKTDSIKIECADHQDLDIIKFVSDYGKRFGYTFEVEHVFDRICLVNDAVYICKYTEFDDANEDMAGKWDATGAQFAEPYIFKTLFSDEPITFEDLCQTYTTSVGLGLYLDMNEDLPDVSAEEKELAKLESKWKKRPDHTGQEWEDDQARMEFLRNIISTGHAYHFVGKAGLFCPMKPGAGGGLLVRENNGKYAYAAGAKGYRWMESEMVKALGKEDEIDISFYAALADKAVAAINEYGDFEQFSN